MSLLAGTFEHSNVQIAEADLIANNPIDFVAPVTGYISAVYACVDKAVTTGGTIGVSVGATPSAVPGAQVAVPNAAVKGAVYKVFTATPGSAGRAVTRGDRIRLVPAGFATAGRLNFIVTTASADTSPQEAL